MNDERTKTRTQPLRQRDYISAAGQLSLCHLIDDAVERLGVIRCQGVGQQQKRSRWVIHRSFDEVLLAAGYTQAQAWDLWKQQVVALDELNANAEES